MNGFTKDSIQEIRDLLLKFRKFISSMPNYHANVKGDIEYHTLEVQDILHDIEFSKLERTPGYKKVRALQKAQRARREAKELHEFTTVLNTFAGANKKIINEINKLISDLDKIVNQQETRIYSPKTDTEIEIAFQHFELK